MTKIKHTHTKNKHHLKCNELWNNDSIYRKSPDDMPDMVFSLTFWFHINASVVKWPSAAIFICSRVQVIFSASRFTSYQLSSYQPIHTEFHEKRTLNSFINITRFYRFHQLQTINTMPLIIQSVYESCEFIHFKSSVKLNSKYYCNFFSIWFFCHNFFFGSFHFVSYHLILLSTFVMACRWHTED